MNTITTDPVCGMTVTEATAAGKSTYQATTYGFCCSHCKARFDQDPEQYLAAKTEMKKGGCGCGCGPS